MNVPYSQCGHWLLATNDTFSATIAVRCPKTHRKASSGHGVTSRQNVPAWIMNSIRIDSVAAYCWGVSLFLRFYPFLLFALHQQKILFERRFRVVCRLLSAYHTFFHATCNLSKFDVVIEWQCVCVCLIIANEHRMPSFSHLSPYIFCHPI